MDPHQRNIEVRITGPLWGEFTGEFPAQRTSNAEKASIWWRHHATLHLQLPLKLGQGWGIAPHTKYITDGVSNHQPHHCLLNRLFRRTSKKTSKLRVTGLCVANSPVTGEFPAQMAGNAGNVSIWWRHHAIDVITYLMPISVLNILVK